MKNIVLLTLVLTVLVATSIPGEAHAGWFKKDKKVEVNETIHRFELFPSMAFFSGTLQRDLHAGWRLDGLSLQLIDKNAVTIDSSGEGFLKAGRQAIVMGVKHGTTLVAYRVRVMEPDYGYGHMDAAEEVTEGPHPNISIGHGPH